MLALGLVAVGLFLLALIYACLAIEPVGTR
jgi:hypothetical protein